MSGLQIAGTVSGVEATIHCGDELWFSVGMEMSLVDQRSPPLRQRYSNAGFSDAQLRQRPCFPHFVLADERCRSFVPSPYCSRNATAT